MLEIFNINYLFNIVVPLQALNAYLLAIMGGAQSSPRTKKSDSDRVKVDRSKHDVIKTVSALESYKYHYQRQRRPSASNGGVDNDVVWRRNDYDVTWGQRDGDDVTERHDQNEVVWRRDESGVVGNGSSSITTTKSPCTQSVPPLSRGGWNGRGPYNGARGRPIQAQMSGVLPSQFGIIYRDDMSARAADDIVNNNLLSDDRLHFSVRSGTI